MKFAIVRNHMQVGGVEMNLQCIAIEIKKAEHDIDVWVWSASGNEAMIKTHQQFGIPLKVGVPDNFDAYDIIIVWDPTLYSALQNYKGTLVCIVGNRSEGYYGTKIRDEFPVAGCICDSNDTMDFVRQFSQDVACIKWHYMTNPEFLFNEHDNTYGIPKHHTILGTMCGMRKQKNVDRIIRGFATYLDRRKDGKGDPFLLIGGDGPMRKEWEVLANKILPKHMFRFAGHISPPRIGRFLSTLDCFIHATSAGQGGICMSMCDATGAGCAVITNDVAGVTENLVEGTTSFVSTDEDFDDFLPGAIKKIVEMREDFDKIKKSSRAAYMRRYQQQGDIVEWLTNLSRCSG